MLSRSVRSRRRAQSLDGPLEVASAVRSCTRELVGAASSRTDRQLTQFGQQGCSGLGMGAGMAVGLTAGVWGISLGPPRGGVVSGYRWASGGRGTCRNVAVYAPARAGAEQRAGTGQMVASHSRKRKDGMQRCDVSSHSRWAFGIRTSGHIPELWVRGIWVYAASTLRCAAQDDLP